MRVQEMSEVFDGLARRMAQIERERLRVIGQMRAAVDRLAGDGPGAPTPDAAPRPTPTRPAPRRPMSAAARLRLAAAARRR